MGLRKCIKNTIYIAGAAAVATYLYRKGKYSSSHFSGNYSPLIDEICVTTDGVISEQYFFDWDDEERCVRATSVNLDSYGAPILRKVYDFEHYDDKILVAESVEQPDVMKAFSIYTRNEYGMISSIINRMLGGKEQRINLVMDGAELLSYSSGEDTLLFKWEEGNIVNITSSDGVREKRTYYKNVENHLFPDINMLISGLSPEMTIAYLMGMRTRNFLRTIVKSAPECHQQTFISYMIDHYDRPIQVLMETTSVSKGMTTKSNKEFDIVYKRL